MGGTYSFIYLFDAGESDGIKNPAVLREMERFQAEADTAHRPREEELLRRRRARWT